MNRKRKWAKICRRAWAALMAVIMAFPLGGAFVLADDEDADDSAATQKIAQLKDEYAQLQQKQKEINNQINAAKSEREKKIAVSQQIGAQIETTAQQIEVLDQRIRLLQQNIEQKEKEIARKQQEYDDQYELFKKRFRAMTSIPNGSTLGVVLGANSYTQMITSSQVMSRVAEYDNQVMENLAKEKEQLQQMREDLEGDKEDVENDKSQMNEKKGELKAQQDITKSQIQDIAAMEQEFLANKEAMQKKMQQMQAEMNAIYAELAKKARKVPYVGGVMSWPTITSLNQVTSEYGPRFQGSDYHTGIDISGGGAYGQPVLAANAGVVAKVGFSAGGYGNFIIVDHGGGITTLYGHCSRVTASEGQSVMQGDKIAEIGSTGWSTGPHVHFEVRVNGTHTNPVAYLQG